MWGGDGWWLMLRSDGRRPVAHEAISRIVTSVDPFKLAVALDVNLNTDNCTQSQSSKGAQ